MRTGGHGGRRGVAGRRRTINAEGTDILILIAVVGTHLLVALAIPRFPLPAIVAATIVDGVDQTIFQQGTDPRSVIFPTRWDGHDRIGHDQRIQDRG